MISMKLQQKKVDFYRQDYQLAMISAMSQEKIIANQIVQGPIDAVIFDNFIYDMLSNLVKEPEYMERDIVLFMDNAVIHRHSQVLETCRAFKVNVVFNS